MKRVLAIGMVLLLLLSMAGCAKEKEKKSAAASDVVASEEQTETEPTIVPNQGSSEPSEEQEQTPAPEQEKTPVNEPEKTPTEEQEETPKQPEEPKEPEEEVDPEELAEQKKEQYREELAKKLEGTWTRTHTKYLLYDWHTDTRSGRIDLPMTVEFKDGTLSIRFDTTDGIEAQLLSIYRPYYQENASNKDNVEQNAMRQTEYMLQYLNEKRLYNYELYDSNTLLIDGVDAGTVAVSGNGLRWLTDDVYSTETEKMIFTRV